MNEIKCYEKAKNLTVREEQYPQIRTTTVMTTER